MAVYRCLLCYPDVKEYATLRNMKSHLGTIRYADHNMGPFRCQVPGCTKRAVRDDIKARHGSPSHAPIWAKDQALVNALDTLAQQCEYPWAPQFAPATCELAPLAATQGPHVAAQGHSGSASVAHDLVQGSLACASNAAVQVPAATAQTPAIAASVVPQTSGVAQAPMFAVHGHPAPALVTHAPVQGSLAGASTAAVQVPPVAAQDPAAGHSQTNRPQLTYGPGGEWGWIAPTAEHPRWTPPDVDFGHYRYAEAVTRRRNQDDNSGSSEEE